MTSKYSTLRYTSILIINCIFGWFILYLINFQWLQSYYYYNEIMYYMTWVIFAFSAAQIYDYSLLCIYVHVHNCYILFINIFVLMGRKAYHVQSVNRKTSLRFMCSLRSLRHSNLKSTLFRGMRLYCLFYHHYHIDL